MADDANVNDRQTTMNMTVLMTPDMANFSGTVHGDQF
jgi:acyl-CoA hydrolase